MVNGVKIGRYTADFRYLHNNETVVEDEYILCWMDVEEMDLWYEGAKLNLSISENKCDYVGIKLYNFWLKDFYGKRNLICEINGSFVPREP